LKAEKFQHVLTEARKWYAEFREVSSCAESKSIVPLAYFSTNKMNKLHSAPLATEYGSGVLILIPGIL